METQGKEEEDKGWELVVLFSGLGLNPRDSSSLENLLESSLYLATAWGCLPSRSQARTQGGISKLQKQFHPCLASGPSSREFVLSFSSIFYCWLLPLPPGQGSRSLRNLLACVCSSPLAQSSNPSGMKK